jgi:hypothetical protein
LDINKERLNFAQEQMHVNYILEAREDFSPDVLMSCFNGALPSVIFDATRNPNSMKNAFN